MYKVKIVFHAREGYRFDRDYYVKNHLELIRTQLHGRVRLTRLEAEWNVRELNLADVEHLEGSTDVLAPLILSLYLETKEDLEALFAFSASPAALPLIQNIPNFTDLAPQWTIAELEAFDLSKPA